MHVLSRGVTWDSGGLARAYSVIGRIVVASGLAATFVGLPALSLLIVPGALAMTMGFIASLDAPREVPGETVVEADGTVRVRIAKKWRTVERANVRGAWLLRRLVNMREYYWVEMALHSGTIVSVRVDSSEEGKALVDALGFGTAGRAVRMPLAKRTRRLFHPLIVIAAFALATSVPDFGWPDLVPVGMVIAYELLRFVLRAPVLEIGHDALHVHRGVRKVKLGRVAIARASASSSLVIERKDGSQVRVGPFGLDRARLAAAAAVIDERLGDRPGPAKADAFERKGRSPADWRAGVRASLDPTYRSAGASTDDANAVLASSTASVEQRIGAALALRVAGEPVTRVRTAAEGTVDPKVRVVLDAIADGADDEHLDATLRAMER